MEIVVAVSTPSWMHCLEHLVLVCLVFIGPTSTEHQKTHRIMSCLKIIRSIVYIGCQKGPFLILIPFFFHLLFVFWNSNPNLFNISKMVHFWFHFSLFENLTTKTHQTSHGICVEFAPQHQSPSLVDPQAELGMLNLQVSFRYYMISRGTPSLKLTGLRISTWMVGRLVSFCGLAYFQVRTVSFREGILFHFQYEQCFKSMSYLSLLKRS